MKNLKLTLANQVVFFGTALLLAILLVSWFAINSHEKALEAEAVDRLAVQTNLFAQYDASTIKRINELLLDLRAGYEANPEGFSDLVRRRQEFIEDISFQVVIIGSDGIMLYSNKARATERVDLSDRAHFAVHQKAPKSDKLFISEVVVGKVTGKASVQFTRPIIKNGAFDGVVVVSVAPEILTSFSGQMKLDASSVATVAKGDGIIISRAPLDTRLYGKLLSKKLFAERAGTIEGSGRSVAEVDGADRFWAYRKLVEYDLVFVIAVSAKSVLAQQENYAMAVGIGALSCSFLLASALLLFRRTLIAQESLQKSLEQGKKSAEAANRAKGNFLSVMGHELRTPMGGIMGMTELARELATDPEQQNYLDTASDSARMLMSLLNDILDYAKSDSGSLSADAVQYNLRDVCYSAIGAIEVQAKAKGLALSFEMHPDVPEVAWGDPGKLRLVLSHLLGNALKFTSKGELALRVGLESGQGQARFEVSDTGIGIEPANYEKIFQAFTQVDSSMSRKYSGVGLGLAICSRFVELMGGAISVNSALGKGSSFVFTTKILDVKK